MNGDITEAAEVRNPPLWERLGCGHIARLCRRKRRRVAPDGSNSKRKENRRRINRPPSAQYSPLSEALRTNTPSGLQCALFCGGSRCKYELPSQKSSAIQGLYSDWVTDDILAMARPSTTGIAARNIIQQFHSWGIRTVINLQMAGEHASCGPPLTKSGFTYDPVIFMANDIYYYNFAWPDYGEASLSGLLDMAKVLSFALQEGRVAIHCHAVKEVCRCKTKLNGKVALVTGGNSGIGLETARELASRGAKVIIASRDVARSAAAVSDIISTTGNPQVHHKHLDLSKFDSIRTFAEDFNKNEDELHILVNNAGMAGTKPKLSEDGIEMSMQINHFGPALLTDLLIDKLKASASSRIIFVSSLLHQRAKLDFSDLIGKNVVNPLTRYANSKLFNIMWAKALAKRLPKGVTANSLHPGVVKTDIYKRMKRKAIVLKIIELFFKTSKEGAQTVIHLCISPELEGISGGYFTECRLRSASKTAENEDLVEKVWEETWKVINDRLK